MTLERGTILHKRYRVVEILGQGGMGSVYRAVDENLGVDVALKENLFSTAEYARQFRLEAVILANLRHPNLPRVSDHFVFGDQGQYLVMDFIDGEDLRQRMERLGTISDEEAIMIGAAICDALSYLHTSKPPILHRDLKPGNVKITPDGHIFLVDFGLAKVVQGSQATTTGARAMTPGYSPPEQYGTARTDSRTDIYSLGATLYAALTGIIPEDGLARAMENVQLTPLRKRNKKVSRRLAVAIEQAMAVDPGDRYQSADEFKSALLGSKAKTQRQPGQYTVPPPPPGAEPTSDPTNERTMQDTPVPGPAQLLMVEPDNEFRPPNKKKRGPGCFSFFLFVLLTILAGLGAVSYFYPYLVPDPVVGYIPWIDPTPTNTATPQPTPTALPSSTPTLIPASATPSSTPTSPLLPTQGLTYTPTLTFTSSPTPVGGGFGQIAFTSDRTGVPQIYLANVDGSGLQPLTNLSDGACQPSWSNNGTRLVFTSPCRINTDTYRDSNLYIINADGSGLTALATVPGGDFDPDWSPNDDRLAFTSLRDGTKEIYVLSLDSMQVTRLTTSLSTEESSKPAWSPFGNQIAFVKKRVGALQIWTMTDLGQNPVQLVRSGQQLWDFDPVWSPDGTLILFSQRQVDVPSLPWIMQIRYEERELQTATRLRLGVAGIENLRFSSDGQWVVCEGVDESENKDIYILTTDGTVRTRLTTDPADDFDPAWRPVALP
jgi:eukaryotic-like serine/threonine-protein kinase